MSAAARAHASMLAARTRRLNASIAISRGIDKPRKRSAREVADNRRENNNSTIDDRLGTRSLADTAFWEGRSADAKAVYTEVCDSRRVFVLAAGGGIIGIGLSVWFHFKLGSVKSRGGVAAAPVLNEIIEIRGEGGNEQMTMQVDRLNVSYERLRTGVCMCRISRLVNAN